MVRNPITLALRGADGKKNSATCCKIAAPGIYWQFLPRLAHEWFGIRVASSGRKPALKRFGTSMPVTHATEFLNIRDLPPVDLIFGRSSTMAAARDKMERVANTPVPVLLQGES